MCVVSDNPIKSRLIMCVVYINPIKSGLTLCVVFDNPIKSGLILRVVFDNPIKSGLIMHVVYDNPIKSKLTNAADICLLWVGKYIKMRRKISLPIHGLIMFRGKINPPVCGLIMRKGKITPTIRGLILWAIYSSEAHRRGVEGSWKAYRRAIERILKAHWWDKKRPQCSRTAALSESKHRLLRGYKHKIA